MSSQTKVKIHLRKPADVKVGPTNGTTCVRKQFKRNFQTNVFQIFKYTNEQIELIKQGIDSINQKQLYLIKDKIEIANV